MKHPDCAGWGSGARLPCSPLQSIGHGPVDVKENREFANCYFVFWHARCAEAAVMTVVGQRGRIARATAVRLHAYVWRIVAAGTFRTIPPVTCTGGSCRLLRCCLVRPSCASHHGMDSLGGTTMERLDIRQTAVRNLSSLLASPPECLLLSHAAFDAGHVRNADARWRETGDTALAARDYGRVRELASTYGGHRYLPVPIEASCSEADSVCRLLGAHVLTITSWEEYRCIRRLQLTHRLVRAWLGLAHVARPQQWGTGEPLAFRNLGTRVRLCREVRWYQLIDNTSGWFYEADAGEPIPGFAVAEWD